MHAENIAAMKCEVLRLLGYTVDVLKAVTDAPDLTCPPALPPV